MKKIFTLFAVALLGLCAYAQDTTEPCPSQLYFKLLNADDPAQVEIELQLTNASENLNGFNMQVTCDKDNPEAPIFKRVNWKWFATAGYGTTILSRLDAPDDVKESMLSDFCDIQSNYRTDIPCLVIIEILKTLDCRFFPVLEEPAGIGKFYLDFTNYEDGDYTLTALNTPSACSFSFTGGEEGNRAWTADEPVTLTLTKNGNVITVKGEEPQPITVTGNVTDVDNNPLEGVTVTLAAGEETMTATTNAEGAYTFEVVPAEGTTYNMTFEKAGYVTETLENVDINNPIETVVLEREKVNVTGLVTDVDNNPLEGVTVTLAAGEETMTATTNAEGAYTFEVVPAEGTTYNMTFEKAGYVTETLENVDINNPIETVVLELQKVTVTGLVTDKENNPLEGVAVTLNVNATAKDAITATTDAEGKYTMEVVPVEGATYTLNFNKDGYEPQTIEVTNLENIPTVILEDINTGINTIGIDFVNGRVYDLQGRELKSVPEHGIFIVNGKVYVK